MASKSFPGEMAYCAPRNARALMPKRLSRNKQAASGNRSGMILTGFISGIILLVLGLSLSSVINSTVANMTTGENATAMGSAAVSMWQIVPIAVGVVLLMISIGMAWMGMRAGK